MVVRQDPISLGLTAISLSLLVFLSTFGVDLLIKALFISGMVLIGLVMGRYFKIEDEDVHIDRSEYREIIMWSAASLFVIVALNWFVPKIPLSIVTSLDQIPLESRQTVSVEFGALIAVGEEQFFRGFVGNLLVSKVRAFGGLLATMGSGLFFGLYHLAIYGTQPTNLLIVTGAGMILTYATLKTRRVSVALGPHVLNNIWSYL